MEPELKIRGQDVGEGSVMIRISGGNCDNNFLRYVLNLN